MAGASVKMDLGGLQNLVQGLMQGMHNRQALMDAIGEALVSSTLERFEKSVSPDGKSWAANKRGGQILVDTGQLKGSIVYEASSDMVIVGTNKIYAAIHQFGGPAGKNHSVTIEARPYLGINDDDREEIRYLAEQYLARNLGIKG